MTTHDTYTVNVTREGIHYLADVPAVPGAHTFAESLDALGVRVAEVIRLMADLPDDAHVALAFSYSWRDEVQPTSVLITVEHYESLLETIEDLRDRLSFHERTGDTIPVDQLIADLDLGDAG